MESPKDSQVERSGRRKKPKIYLLSEILLIFSKSFWVCRGCYQTSGITQTKRIRQKVVFSNGTKVTTRKMIANGLETVTTDENNVLKS